MRNPLAKLVSNLNPTLWKPVLGLAAIAALASACGSSTSSTPGTGGSSAGSAGNTGSAGNGVGGTTGTGGSGLAGNDGGSGVAGSTGGTTAGSAGSGTAGSTGGNVGSGGNSTAGNGGVGTGGSTGGNVGTGGNATGGSAQGGRGGSSAGAGGASTGSGGKGGSSTGGSGGASGGTTGTGGSGGSGTGSACTCPTGASFCSDFETNALPTGAIYAVNAAPGDWSRDFAVDSTQHKCGSSSLLVKNQSAAGSSGSAYRMLAVPAPGTAFWARFWVMSDMVMGMSDHNAFAGGSIGSMPNDTKIEFAEDVGIAFNTQDSDAWPTGYGRLTGGGTNPYMLPAMTWACVELSFNGTGHMQAAYVNGTQLINATNYPSGSLTLTYFKFGFESFHGPTRQMWYDAVAVAAARIGCN